jgi:MtaA/CmuA family methyltransferase
MRHLVFPINALPSCQMVDTGIDDILWDANLKFEALRRYYDKIDADLLFYLGDVAIQAEAMGATIAYYKEGMPAVQYRPQAFHVSDPADVPRMKVNAQVMKRMEKEFPDKIRVAQLFGAFTVAGQIAGEETILKGLVEDQREVIAILEKTFECARRYADYLVEAGANLVWISDPLAVLIPPDQFWKFAGIYLKRIFDAFSAFPTFLHICGDTYQIIREMVDTGVGGISFDNCMDLLVVEDEIPDDVYLIGNIDPVGVIELGSPDEVASHTSDLVSIMAHKDNFILSTGCAVPPLAPLENIRLFVETGRESFGDFKSDTPLIPDISHSVYLGDGEATLQGVMTALEAKVDPLRIITRGLTRAMRKGSAMYDAKLCFLPSILLMVDAFYRGFQALEHRLDSEKAKQPDIIIGTVKGDIHEIGKNLVRIFLETHGHNVIDLGVDVSANSFMEAYEQYVPSIIGLSAFTTQSKKELENIINVFHSEGIRDVLFIVGGATVNHEVSRSVGAHGYARDAVRAVSLVEKLLKQKA